MADPDPASSLPRPPRDLTRSVGLTLLAAVPAVLLALWTPLQDPTVPLLVVVAWRARHDGRRAGLASAAVALLIVAGALASGVFVAVSGVPGPAVADVGVLAARVALALLAVPLVAWLASAPPVVGHSSGDARTLAEALPQIVWMSGADGRIDWINHRGLAYAGLTLERARDAGWLAAVHDDDHAPTLARWEASLRDGSPFEVEYRLRRAADGAYRWHLGRALAVRDGGGAIVRWIGTCTDIHDQREAAEAIRKWEHVFRHSSWGVLVLDAATDTITAANPAFARMHDRPDGDMQGTRLADAVAPESRAALAEHHARAARDGHAVAELAHLRADGSRFPVLVETTEVRADDGRASYRIANYLDLSLARAADAARETAEQRFRAVQDASPDPFLLWDFAGGRDVRDACLRYANPAANLLLGRDLRDDLGRRMREIFPTADDAARMALYERVHRTGVTSEVTSFHEGLRRWLRLVVVKIGDGIGVLGTDVTAAKEAEAVLRRTRDELEQLVSERTRELHHARDLAVQANRAKSDFLSRASHELRTPLSSVIGFSNILLKNKQGSLAPDELTYLSRIAKNGRNLLALVNDLLDLSKIEAGRVDLELSPVSLFDVLYEVQDTLEPRAAELGLELRVEVAQENDLIIADETRLRQVLVNLAGNAIKYTARGSVVIRVVSNAAGAPARIDVVDTGPGIPAERLDAIFQPFIVDATPASGDAATGLGLAITRALCDLMGYRLTVDSRVDQGSTFSVHLLPGEGVRSALQLGSLLDLRA